MIVSFGKHRGKSAALLVLKHPDYVRWLQSAPNLKGAALALRNECELLIAKYDATPIVWPCFECKKAATRSTFYLGNVSLCYAWCESCDPYYAGAIQGKLTCVTTYNRALTQADLYNNGKVTALRQAVQALGRAKGLGKSVTENQAAAFFA